ncbi:MAG: hypothetical protein JAY99_06465 [Candidatus Thiodiazotropha lotti]|uniref:hypothetical protein n=1 Tax=Candidatus Thiodiazotropha endoloripes TaxID=1818881 RepID=UPI00083DCCD8|nr:hypothetical protein [Candidatus Thiodiazotropha endoloripes]MCG7990218.1 hypothetical protein [Candidatus Thiodiazotropha lotti]MCW4181871.1 hypothetical protein [Candidatus Thiodiazotropha weberae]MCG7999146.1 hypothetical protein [Candidatus Thiodiazotropha lotti]MCW4190914.1 hypothetical protein [Candidatus Thiodiazotropha weberae]ODB89914.1 hypothetical protein A3194_11310 [Candidatus Thiodiazotropha endoloripes]
MSLDRGTRIYAGILGSLVGLSLLAWLLTLDFRLAEIDKMLKQDKQIAAYPYRFKALEIKGTTAILSTPRTSAVPAVKFLSMIFPRLSRKSEQDPAVIAAQKQLGKIQGKVRELVLSRQDIERVSWRIDRAWYAQKGVLID